MSAGFWFAGGGARGIGERGDSPAAVLDVDDSSPSLSRIQWASIILLASSVASIQIAKSGSNHLEMPLLPVLLTIVSSGLSGISGVITEKLMKGKKDVSIFQQNIWLSLSRLWFVAIIVGAPCLTSSAWLWGTVGGSRRRCR